MTSGWLALCLGLLGGEASADPQSTPPDIVEELSDGVILNWTTLVLEVTASARRARLPSLRATEEHARREVGVAIRQTIGRVPVDSHTLLAGVLEASDVGPALQARTGRWLVQEVTYGSSGRVELRAALSIHDVLKPWLLAEMSAAPGSPCELPATSARAAQSFSGVLIDARGTGLSPAYAAQLRLPGGAELFHPRLRVPAQLSVPPFRFVSDPAHPATASVGPRPLIVRATRAQRADLFVGSTSAQTLREHPQLLCEGTMVVVTDG